MPIRLFTQSHWPTRAKMNIKHGTVVWLTGLSGVGKTTIGEILFQQLKPKNPSLLFLDGDRLRQTIAEDLGYTAADRIRTALRISRLCKLVTEQGIDTICATISLIRECQKWNRQNIPGYLEVFLRATSATRHARDHKKIYQRARDGKEKNVYGEDLVPEFPKNPDLVFDNDGEMSPTDIANEIITAFYQIKKRDS